MGFVRWHIDHARSYAGETAWFGEDGGKIVARCSPDLTVAPGYYGRYRGHILGQAFITDALHSFKAEVQRRVDDVLDDTLHDIPAGDLPPGDAVSCGNRLDLTRRERLHKFEYLGLDERRGGPAGLVIPGVVSACRRCGQDRFSAV